MERKPIPTPVAVTAIPAMPSWLPAESKLEWKRITPELKRMGLLAKIDRGTLIRYCVTWDKWVRSAKVVADPATPQSLDAGREGAKTNPEWRAYVQAEAMLVALGAKLGLSYSDRSRMRAPEPDPVSDDSIFD